MPQNRELLIGIEKKNYHRAPFKILKQVLNLSHTCV